MNQCHIAVVMSSLLLVACSGDGGGSDSSSSSGGNTTTCTLTANTTATSTTNANGCYVLTRDTSSCEAERQAAGLSGVWLKFSCRVSLSAGDNAVVATSDGQPDYKSFYFETTDPCYEAWTEGNHNASSLAATSYTVNFPTSPDATSQAMEGNAVVGLAVNGVPPFSNFAAPGDDIYLEAISFDKCDGHPQGDGDYHYHSEPGAITYDDANLVGFMRDGYPIYGRKDADGTYPTLDTYGGHRPLRPTAQTRPCTITT